MRFCKRWSLRHSISAQELKWWLSQVLKFLLLILNQCMDGRVTYKFKINMSKLFIPNKSKPIVTPNLEVDFVDLSTQFKEIEVNLEFELNHTTVLDQPISSIE